MTHAMTLELPEQVYETLVKMAKRKGQHPEAVDMQWLVTATEGMVDDPFEQFIGAFSSNVPDWADRHKERATAVGVILCLVMAAQYLKSGEFRDVLPVLLIGLVVGFSLIALALVRQDSSRDIGVIFGILAFLALVVGCFIAFLYMPT